MRLHRLALAVLALASATAGLAQPSDADIADQLATCAPSLALAARAPDSVKLQVKRNDAGTLSGLATGGTQALLGKDAADVLLRRKFAEFNAGLPRTMGPQLVAAIDGASVPCAKFLMDNFDALKPRIEAARARNKAAAPAVAPSTAAAPPAAAQDDKPSDAASPKP